MSLEYLSGFGNEFESEALAGALPAGQFNPQKAPHGLYAEQLSTTAFTAPRHTNRRLWFYRIRPSVLQGRFALIDIANWLTAPLDGRPAPDQYRWDPLPDPTTGTDFLTGMLTYAANGDVRSQHGIGIHLYAINESMNRRYFYNADGELLIVPQRGTLQFRTECGILSVSPGEICVIPRGLKFAVDVVESSAGGYVCENYGEPLRLPERGPIGANGLANTRDFLHPVASFEDIDGTSELVAKFSGGFFSAPMDHSPLDVVAWTGNSAPYKYDLSRFNVINTVSFDHPDPSIFTVLTSQTTRPGIANVDFVIFPPRWMVAEDTFRPPWYHRNIMSEFMGLIQGVYDAKEEGFVPGGASLHNCMSPHGPEAGVFEKASIASLSPQKYEDTLAFMFESSLIIQPSSRALASETLQGDYPDCWQSLARHFRVDD